MTNTEQSLIGGVLSPVERFSEALFGLIMTLSITGTMSVVAEGEQDVKTMLLGVLGCNIAWGIIDGLLYLLGTIAERGRSHRLSRLIRDSTDKGEAQAALMEALPEEVAGALSPEDLDAIRQRLAKLPERQARQVITSRDIVGAAGVFLLVVLSCVPVIVPFLLLQDPLPALRLSNAIAIVMLFVGGYNFARYSGLSKVPTGLVMVLVGVAMVGLTIALGG